MDWTLFDLNLVLKKRQLNTFYLSLPLWFLGIVNALRITQNQFDGT